MNKKYLFLFFFILILYNFIFSETAEEIFYNNTFTALKDSIEQYAIDVSKISGLYAVSGEVRGSASIGSFPSFRVNASSGFLFYNNPVFFLKKINFANLNWDTLLNNTGAFFSWLYDYFIPLPVAFYSFDIGLPKGFSVGMKFNYAPYGEFLKAVISDENMKNFVPTINVWQLGVHFNYCIVKDYKFFPSIAIGAGVYYTDSRLDMNPISVGNISYDNTNDNIPTSIGFNSVTNTTSFFIDFTISKKFVFFEPFISMKLIQSINHNLTKYTVKMDLTNTSSDFKEIFKEEITISNRESIDSFGNEIGVVIPSIEFIIATGFEFVIVDMVRLGVEGSFGCVSKCGVVSMSIKFQMEKQKFDKLKKGVKK